MAEARAARGERMKEAKREAEAVIVKLRAEKQAEFEASSQATATMDEFADLKSKTDLEISGMKKEFGKNKSSVTDMIVGVVTDVDVKLSETRKLQGKRTAGLN